MAYGVGGPFNADPAKVYLGNRDISQEKSGGSPVAFFAKFMEQANFPASEATDAKGNIHVTVQVNGQELTYSSTTIKTQQALVDAFNADMACLALNELEGVDVISTSNDNVTVSHQGIAVNVRLFNDEGELAYLEGATFDASAFLKEFNKEFVAKKEMASVLDGGRPYQFKVKDPGAIPLPACLNHDLFVQMSHGEIRPEVVDPRIQEVQEEAPER